MNASLRLLARTLFGAWLASACAAPPPAPRSAGATDTERVAQAIARFNAAVSRHDFAAMADAFSEDAVWEASAGKLGFRHEGRAAIQAWLTDNPGRVEVLFYLAGPSAIELQTAGRAHAFTSVTELLRSRDTGEVRQLFGVYRDELVDEGGRFRFAHRRFELRHDTPLEVAHVLGATRLLPKR
jgi:ketosteroid isomerase-like protein